MASQKPLLARRRLINTGTDLKNTCEQHRETFEDGKCQIGNKMVTVHTYSSRVVNALKHMDDVQHVSYYKGKTKRLVALNRVKASVHWIDFQPNPKSPYRNHLYNDRKTKVTGQDSDSKFPKVTADVRVEAEVEAQGDQDNDKISFSNDDQDYDERNSNIPAVIEKRNRRARVKVPCRQLSNYEWCTEWLFKLCNHPCTTLPLL